MSADSAHSPDASVPQDRLLSVEGLTKRFGGLTAVDDLSFDVAKGEILGFIGPNGAGKSTTFNCITGVYTPTSGRIEFDGRDLTGMATNKVVKAGISRTFQTFRPLSDRTVRENVELALIRDDPFTLEGLLGGTKREAIAVCERVGLGDRLEQFPSELPHAGMLRLELARAIATDPKLLLVDEPFAGLAPGEVEEVSDLLLELRQEGYTIVVVDHNMRGLFPVVDRVIVIQFGSLIAAGSPGEIRDDPTVQEAYLGAESL